jgi:YfiH family protein
MKGWIFRDGFYILEGDFFLVKVSTKLINEASITCDVWLNQIHSDKIYIIDDIKNLPKGNLDGDGIILKLKNVKSRVRTADCYPTILIDKKNKIGAILHIGWRGSYLRILEKCIRIFQDNFYSRDIMAIFGPGICSKCYEVKEDLFNYFPREYFHFKNEKIFFDILTFNIDILKKFGTNEIIYPPSCTFENPILYSHRRNEKSRILTILEMF